MITVRLALVASCALLVLVLVPSRTAASVHRNHDKRSLGGEVSLMLNVIGSDADAVLLRVPSISANLNADFGGHRYFVVDTYRSNGTVPTQLQSAMAQMITEELMDGVMVVNDTAPYMEAWDREWGGGPVARLPRIGNQVYYFMVQACPTRFLVHLDLDMLTWSAPGYNWVAEALSIMAKEGDSNVIQALSAINRGAALLEGLDLGTTLMIQSSAPWYHPFVEPYDWRWAGLPLKKLINIVLGSRFAPVSVDTGTWMSTRMCATRPM